MDTSTNNDLFWFRKAYIAKYTIYRQIYIYTHYDNAPSTKDNITKGRPLFQLWSFVWWHDIER